MHATTLSNRADALVTDFFHASASTIHQRLGPVAGVAVSTWQGRVPRSLGASTPIAADVDRIQFSVGVGPCLAAMHSGKSIYVPDLAADGRWGAYGPLAAARGAAACLSVPVLLHDRPVGVFKVYAGQTHGVSDVQRHAAQVVATEISGSFGLVGHLSGQAATLDDITALMTHRRVIDLAVGILMERAQVSGEAAFALLRAQSQHRNAKLSDVAADVVASVPGSSAEDLVPHFNLREHGQGRGG